MISLFDEKDERIIELPGWGNSQKSKIVAKQMGVSSATVQRRISKLVKSGILHFGPLVDPEKVGEPVGAIIGIRVPTNNID